MYIQDLTNTLESLLFVSVKPVSIKKLALHCNASLADVKQTLNRLSEYYSLDRGITLILHNESAQFASNPRNAETVRSYLKLEHTGELTRSAIETLSIIAYRGPITREDIEHIRGINCAIALRNLLIRGLVEMKEEKHTGAARYSISIDFMRHLGMRSLEDLPEYGYFHSQELQKDSTSGESQ